MRYGKVNTGALQIRNPSAQLKRQLAISKAKTAVVLQPSAGGAAASFRYNRMRRCFQINGKTYSGLCRPLHAVVLPDQWNLDRLVQGAHIRSSTFAQAHSTLVVVPQQSGKKQRKARWTSNPMARGRAVHAAFDKWFKSGAVLPKSGWVPVIHAALRDAGLTVVETEAPVWWDNMMMATRVDILCRDGSGSLVIVELKTLQGKFEGLGLHQTTFRAPFHAMQGSLLNIHYMQALGSELLFEQSRPGTTIAGCAVLYVKSDFTACYKPVPASVRRYKSELMIALARLRITRR
jgi:hypothetical protein